MSETVHPHSPARSPRRSARALIAGVVALALLSGCGEKEGEGPQAPGDERIVGKDWQVTAIHTSPDAPSDIPDSLVEVPRMSFGESGIVGTTGCTRFVADASYSKDGKPANIREATHMKLDKVRFDASDEQCGGSAKWADTQVRYLLRESHRFEVRMNPNHQLLLVWDSGKVDSPSIHMVSL